VARPDSRGTDAAAIIVAVEAAPEADDGTGAEELAAGGFSAWLAEIRGALRGERGSDVPCDGCTACCTSSQFVHIDPDETDTLAHIPAELLFPAPLRPRGHVLLGYDERGHCPMLVDGVCSIYEHRPRTCRTYDCRVFPATGIAADDGDGAISARARRWRFDFAGRADGAEYEAVRKAARFLGVDAARAGSQVPANNTQRAVLAIKIHEVFLRGHEITSEAAVADPAPGIAPRNPPEPA
jgi:Fe-S-cluster containining protein